MKPFAARKAYERQRDRDAWVGQVKRGVAQGRRHLHIMVGDSDEEWCIVCLVESLAGRAK